MVHVEKKVGRLGSGLFLTEKSENLMWISQFSEIQPNNMSLARRRRKFLTFAADFPFGNAIF